MSNILFSLSERHPVFPPLRADWKAEVPPLPHSAESVQGNPFCPVYIFQSLHYTRLKKVVFRTCKASGKIPQALRGEDDFFHEPEGLGLACTGRTRITFACGYGDSATVCSFFPICLFA